MHAADLHLGPGQTRRRALDASTSLGLLRRRLDWNELTFWQGQPDLYDAEFTTTDFETLLREQCQGGRKRHLRTLAVCL